MKKAASTSTRVRSFDWDVDFPPNGERSTTFFYPSGFAPSGYEEGTPTPRPAAYLLPAATAIVAVFSAVAFLAMRQLLPG